LSVNYCRLTKGLYRMNQNNQNKQQSDTLTAEKPEVAPTAEQTTHMPQQPEAQGAIRSDGTQPQADTVKKTENSGSTAGPSQSAQQPQGKATSAATQQNRP
jgi:hypothetical protein